MKNEVLKIIIKVFIYALGLIGSYVGITSLTSCSASRLVDSYGTTHVVISDTTIINHSGKYNLNIK